MAQQDRSGLALMSRLSHGIRGETVMDGSADTLG